ncbi:MAG TPA: hypothetical protein VGP47_00590 [Parachlamydiaceae bacterium]|nr:hypothetical protein [Parachlamydiaceae bacterium]
MSLSEQESTDNQQQQPQNSVHPGEHDNSNSPHEENSQEENPEMENPEMEMNVEEEVSEGEQAQESEQDLESDLSGTEAAPDVEGSAESERDSGKHNVHRQQFNQFLSDIEKLTDHESKLQFAIDFMEASLAQGGTPHFKSFWEARNICLQIFKENIAPAVRMILWAKYNDLSKEARRLKEILDEQSAFAVEQIEIAVKALEDDITSFDDHLEKMPKVDFQLNSMALEKTLGHYEKLQRELNLLNTQASRINAMRKELIRTEMRVRQKNKFFQRLSAAGDKVFPKRKELIKEVSQSFIGDVDTFIDLHFKKENFDDSLFALREEIKTLQNMAKVLTLNTHSFTHTRMRLSECWDRIKNEDKERKKERAQQKTVFKQNFDDSMQKIQEFNQTYLAEQPSAAEATKTLDELVVYIRGLEHGRDELRALRTEVQAARKPILEKIQSQEAVRLNADQERDKQRRQKIIDIKLQAEELLKNSESLDADAIEAQRDALMDLISSSSMGKADKQEIERQLKPLRDLISEKRESSLLSLSDNDRQSLQQLKEVLKQRKERRQEIKSQIDALRKTAGASGLDFEQAMNFNAQVAAEKERLEKINQGVQEVEKKIAQLSKR